MATRLSGRHTLSALARAGEWPSLTSLGHSTARAATVRVHPAARAASRRARPGRLCALPARRAVQPHRPLSWIQRLQWLSIHLVRQNGEPSGRFINIGDERATCVTQCRHPRRRDWRVLPLMVWLGRAVKVVHAAAYASRRGSLLTAPSGQERASRRHGTAPVSVREVAVNAFSHCFASRDAASAGAEIVSVQTSRSAIVPGAIAQRSTSVSAFSPAVHPRECRADFSHSLARDV